MLPLFRMSNKGSTRLPICRENRNHLYGPPWECQFVGAKDHNILRAQRRVIYNFSLKKFILAEGHSILRANRKAICNLYLPQFTMAKGHNI